MRTEVIGDATLYLADCREVLPALSFDLVVTDPPYRATDIGPNHRPAIGGDITSGEYTHLCRTWFNLCADKTDRFAFSCGLKHIWEYPQARWIICWHKPSSVSFSALNGYNTWEPILIYGKLPKGKRVIHDLWQHVPLNMVTEEWAQHPCPKPPALWGRLVDAVSVVGETVCDPFTGSGTTGEAAIRTGRKFIGMEVNERWFDISCRRIEAAHRQKQLFPAA